jgi:tRNA dimethylallyltransferase
VLTGPTGSGKSAIALDLAERLGGEILALDSMTLYRGLDIGTAKPTAEERSRVPHHLLDLLDPWESANVAWWLDRAAEAVRQILGRGKRPIFVGGTPMYLKALLNGLFEAPPANLEIRAKWEAEAERIGKEALHAKLAVIDPIAAAKLHFNDVRRVVRALEVYESTGTPISSLQQTWGSAPANIPAALIEWPREELNRRIDRRVLAMVEAGWPDEVKRLSALPRPLSKEAAQSLGYGEWLAHLRGEMPFEETVELIQLRTRQFAKRQGTWFRQMGHLKVIPASGADLAGRILCAWGQ